MIPKVLVFTVTYEGKDYCFDEFKQQVSQLSYPEEYFQHVWIDNSESLDYYNKLKSEGLDVHRVERGNNAREALSRSQNYARRLAIDGDFDYILSIESDILGIPADIIQRLIKNSKDVVGCFYHIGPPEHRLGCVTINKKGADGLNGTRLVTMKETKELEVIDGLFPVNGCGLGCTLISREVFKDIVFMYYPELKAFSDVFFANDVWRNGFTIFLDSSIKLEHLNNGYPDDR